jgi:predicted PurR-regulated permease PerM
MKGDNADLKRHSRYFFLISVLAFIGISLLLIFPLMKAIIGGMVLGYIFYPIYKKSLKIVKNKKAASLLMSFIVLLVIIVPIFFTANAIINESIKFFYEVRDIDLSTTIHFFDKYLSQSVDLNFYIKELLNKGAISLADWASNFIFSLPGKAISLFVMLFVLYYSFLEGKDFIKKLESYLPLSHEIRKKVSKKFKDVVRASLYGIVVTAILQGVIGGIGFVLFDVSSPILWTIVMIILSMLPFLGASLVWFPASIYKIITGDLFNGIGLLIYGLIIVSLIDNVLRPKIVGSKASIHPIIVLVGVLGGLEVFGLFGIIIGPLILAITLVFLELYISERKKPKKHVLKV